MIIQAHKLSVVISIQMAKNPCGQILLSLVTIKFFLVAVCLSFFCKHTYKYMGINFFFVLPVLTNCDHAPYKNIMCI